MSLNAATIEVLIAKGLSAADLLEVARATEVKADRTNAERQARHRAKRNAVTVTDAPPKENISNPQPSETEVSKGTKRASKKSVSVELPDWLPAEAWEAFVTMRKAMRGVPFTDAAAKGIIADLEGLRSKGHDPEKLLMKAVKRGWRGVFEADDTKAGSTLAKYVPKTADDCERVAAFRASTGQHEEAQELRAKAARLREATGPPGQSIGQVATRILGTVTPQPTTGGPH